jgi:hypothetical protein
MRKALENRHSCGHQESGVHNAQSYLERSGAAGVVAWLPERIRNLSREID